jgi:4-hydroxy-tetrahydrodipicolinate reductase
MRLALIGYGKMGRVIEEIATERGHIITHTLDSSSEITNLKKEDTDMAIEFTRPECAIPHLRYCVEQGIPIVTGTTGWYEKLTEVKDFTESKKGSVLYASNFSVGVNIFFELNKLLAKLMSFQSDYKATIEEIHHTQKLDAPSGTAITLANDLIATNSRYASWELTDDIQMNKGSVLPVIAKREPDVPGTHIIQYLSLVDSIKLTHEAHNRRGFALGAVIAAEWLQHKTGFYTMSDVLHLNQAL